MPRTEPRDDDALDLPPLDAEDESTPALVEDLEDSSLGESTDPFDDAEAGGDPGDALEAFADESAVVDAADLEGPAVSALGADLLADIDDEESALGDEEEDRRIYDDDVDELSAATSEDAGEEGPLGRDEELREEDLPALDEDDGAEVRDEALFERGVLGAEADLLWADRAWDRAPVPADADDEPDDAHVLAPGDEPGREKRDATWRQLEAGARVTAATVVDDGSVVLALATPATGKARLVRIQPDGTARIVAEIEAAAEGDEDAEVSRMRFHDGTLVVHGNFETHAYRPAS